MSRTAWNSVDLSGQRFGRLVAIEKTERSSCGATMWMCKCDCGNLVSVQYSNLKSGATQSCGCLNQENCTNRNRKHNGSFRGKVERLYRVWRGMLGRCEDPKNNSYRYYGLVGISVCDDWKDYEKFRSWAIEHGYDETAERGQCTLDRIDPFGNYEPSNCRWATMKTQSNNRRCSKNA
jgi:hypothetical protein